MGMEALESQLQTAATTERQGTPDFLLTRLIAEVRQREGRPAVVVEVSPARPRAATTPHMLALQDADA